MTQRTDERWQAAYEDARMRGLCHDGAVEAAQAAIAAVPPPPDREDGGASGDARGRPAAPPPVDGT